MRGSWDIQGAGDREEGIWDRKKWFAIRIPASGEMLTVSAEVTS
jgi:hypothetical protein